MVKNTESALESHLLSVWIALQEICEIWQQNVQKYLDKLVVNEPTGHGNLSPWQLKLLKQQKLQPLTSILNISLQLNKDTVDWKQADVLTIFIENGEYIGTFSYRLAYLTSLADEFFQKIIRKKLVVLKG